jgi:hypothetical protein
MYKLKDIFVSIAEPLLAILDPLIDVVNIIRSVLNASLQPVLNILKAIGIVIRDFISEPLKALKGIFSGITDILNGSIMEGFKKIGAAMLRAILTPFQAITDGFVKLINSTTAMLNKLPGINIGEIPAPDLTNSIVGPKVAMAEGGVVTSPINALIGEAGPEAVIPLNKLPNITNNQNTVDSNNNLLQEFKEMKKILAAILHKEGTITLNGTKMGTAMAVGSYKVQ